MSATRPILTAVRDYLAAELPASAPDLIKPNGEELGQLAGLPAERAMALALTVFGRGLNHDGAALDLLDALRLAITGYRPPDCEPCHLISEQFLAEEGGAWQYQLIAQTETQQVERRPADTRPKVSSLYLRQQGQPLNPDIKPKP